MTPVLTAPLPVAPVPTHPHLHAIVLRVTISLAIAVVSPAVLFAATLVIVNTSAAMIVALAWLGGVIAWRGATGRCVSGLLMLTAAIMAVKTSITFATGNTFIYFVQPVFVDAVVAVVFLSSLLTTQPLVARLAPDFYPMDDAVAARPGVCRMFRRLTLMWGLIILVKGTVTLVLLISLSTVDFVVIKSATILTLTLSAAVVTIAWAVAVARQEGLLHRPVTDDERLR